MEVHADSRVWSTSYQVVPSAGADGHSDPGPFFVCSGCGKCLAGKEVISGGGRNYCWLCFETAFGLKCASCFKSFTGSNYLDFVFYNNQVWHKECFFCPGCGKPRSRTS